MAKKSFISLRRGKRNYNVLVEDIKDVYTIRYHKRPSLPSFEVTTSDELLNQVNLLVSQF